MLQLSYAEALAGGGMANVQETIEAEIRHLKAAEDNCLRLPVNINGKQLAELQPVGWRDANSAEAVERLAHWRAAAADAFPAVFPVTTEGTHRWLIKQLLETADRLLFWVVPVTGQPIGHIGLFRFDYEGLNVEIDNVIRGVPQLLPGLMEASVAALLDWAFSHWRMNDVFLRVFSDNERAIRLYERCGFRETMKMPLRRVVEGDALRWLEVDGAYRGDVSRYFVTMRLTRAAWCSRSTVIANGQSALHAA